MKNWYLIVTLLYITSCNSDYTQTEQLLDENIDKWHAANIDHYQYNYKKSCFCTPVDTAEVSIEVNSDTIISIKIVEDGSQVDTDTYPFFHTVMGLFTLIQEAIDKDAYKLSVNYDAQLGYPLFIDIDYDKNAVDEELTIHTHNLEPL